MSNKDDLIRKRADIYHAETRKMMDKNADNQKIGGKVPTEAEISRKASAIADGKMEEQAKLDKHFPNQAKGKKENEDRKSVRRDAVKEKLRRDRERSRGRTRQRPR